MNTRSTTHITVLGLGNVLYGDEGLGVFAAAELHRKWDFMPAVEVVDGGTLGHTLLGYVERASHLLLLDAVDFGLAPGAVTVRTGDAIPMYLTGHKVSPHQNSFSEVLALAALRDNLPRELVLIGMQPERMDMGFPLSTRVRRGLHQMENKALAQIRHWGAQTVRTAEDRRLCHPCLRIEHLSMEHGNML